MMAVFDTETEDWTRIYAIGYAIDGNRAIINTSENSNDGFIRWLLESLPNNAVVYSHNGGKFDMMFLLDFISREEIEILDFRMIHSSVAMLSFKYDGKSLEFRDSYLILPQGLRSLTNSFDVSHKKKEMDYELGKRDPRLVEYLTNDILGLYEVLQQSGLTKKLTLAANSLDDYLRNFNIVKPYRLPSGIYADARKAYHGGRCEIYRMRGEDLNYYDVNSLYPYVMSAFDYPTIDSRYHFSDELSEYGFYYAYVRVPNIKIPVLPVKTQQGLIFPIGRFKGWYCGCELIEAQSMGAEVAVIKGFAPDKTAPIFSSFVGHYYRQKKESKGAKREIAKLYLNSLYGKFGQRDIIQSYKLVDCDKQLKEGLNTPLMIGNNVFEQCKEKVRGYINRVDIAAQITARARLHLYKLFCEAGFDSVYYADTDSIMTSRTLKTGDGLGELKQLDRVSQFIALSPKLYAYKSQEGDVVLHSKGFRIDQLSYADFEAQLDGKGRIATKRVGMNKFKDYIRRGELSVVDVVRVSRKDYLKRLRVPQGYDTRPICVG